MREKLKLESSRTGHFYTTTKNKRTKPTRSRSRNLNQSRVARDLQGNEDQVERGLAASYARRRRAQ